MEDGRVSVESHEGGHDRDAEDTEPAENQEIPGGDLAAHQRVEVLHQGGGADDHLAGHRRHDRRKHRREDEPRDEGVEKDPAHDEEHLLGFPFPELYLRIAREVADSDERSEDRPRGAQDHPEEADPASGLRLSGAAQRHEPDDDVGLPEVAQAPGRRRNRRNDPQKGVVGKVRKEVEGLGLDLGDPTRGLGPSAEFEDRDDRNRYKRGEHEEALGDVGQRCAEKTAEKGVYEGDDGDDGHSGEIVPAEGADEELARRDHSRRDVEGEEDENDQSRHDAQLP